MTYEFLGKEEIKKIHKTQSTVPSKSEVDLDFRGHPNMVALWNCEK